MSESHVCAYCSRGCNCGAVAGISYRTDKHAPACCGDHGPCRLQHALHRHECGGIHLHDGKSPCKSFGKVCAYRTWTADGGGCDGPADHHSNSVCKK